MTFIIGTPHVHNAGYLESRYSGDSRPVNDDVQTCPHCQAIILMREWRTIAGGWCGKCNAPLCANPDCIAQTDKFGCIPFLKRLEQFTDAAVKFEQHLKIAGLEPRPENMPALIVP